MGTLEVTYSGGAEAFAELLFKLCVPTDYNSLVDQLWLSVVRYKSFEREQW